MKPNLSIRRCWPNRMAVGLTCAAVAAVVVLSSSGCAGNGKLFGRKQPPPPATMKEFLMLPRPE